MAAGFNCQQTTNFGWCQVHEVGCLGPAPSYFALLTLTEAEAQHPPAAGGLGAVEGAEKGSWAAARLTMRGLIGVVVAREALPGTPGCSAGYCLLLRFGRSRLRSGCRGVEDR
jgi:hypothetical protein